MHSCRLVGAADVGLGPLHEVLRPPAVDVAVAGTDVEVEVAAVLHDVGVAQAAATQSGQNHRVGPALSLRLLTGDQGQEHEQQESPSGCQTRDPVHDDHKEDDDQNTDNTGDSDIDREGI